MLPHELRCLRQLLMGWLLLSLWQWMPGVADAACASSPSSDLDACNLQCCGTSVCACSNRPRAVMCEYEACVIVALQRHGCEDDATYAGAYAQATGNAATCNQTLSASGCPSMTLWGDASRCSSGLVCSGALATKCVASCYAETLLCYAGSRCGVGLSMSAVNYCQWLLGTVNGATADGPLGSCYPQLNHSVIEHYGVCVAGVALSPNLNVPNSEEELSRLRAAVLALCVVLGVAITAVGAMVLRWCLPRIIKRRRQVRDAKQPGSSELGVTEPRSSLDGRSSATVKSSLILPLFAPPTNGPAASGSASSQRHSSVGASADPQRSGDKGGVASEDVVGTCRDSDVHELSKRSSSVGWVGAAASTETAALPGSSPRTTGRQRSLTRHASDELVAMTTKLILAGMWDQVRLLGKGASGTVYCCLLGSGALVARKDVDIQDVRATELRLLGEELKVVSRLKHSNCVRYMTAEVHREKRIAVMWMEYLPGGSLASIVSHVGRPLPEHVAKSYLRQVLQGLAYLHANGIVHRDVKADNVLVDSDGIVKLADFGCSKLLRQRKDAMHMSSGSSVSSAGASAIGMATSMVGTPCFMAPEIIGTVDAESVAASVTRSIEVGYGVAADIWSFGIMACEVLSQGAMPWPQMNSYWELMVHISQKDPDIPQHLSASCRSFVLECLVRNPKQRASARALLLHPWLQEPTDAVHDEGASDRDRFGFLNCMRALEALEAQQQQPFPSEPQVASSSGVGAQSGAAAEDASKGTTLVVTVPDVTQGKRNDAGPLQPTPSIQAVPSLHIVLDVAAEEASGQMVDHPAGGGVDAVSAPAQSDRLSITAMMRPSSTTSRDAAAGGVQALSVGTTALSRSS